MRNGEGGVMMRERDDSVYAAMRSCVVCYVMRGYVMS